MRSSGIIPMVEKLKEAILKPTEVEINLLNQILEKAFIKPHETAIEGLERVLGYYYDNPKYRREIENFAKFIHYTGFGLLLAAYDISKRDMDYRTKKAVMMTLTGMAYALNEYIGEMISTDPRFMKQAANLIIGGAIRYLRNLGVKEPEKIVNAYLMYGPGLFSNGIVDLYSGLTSLYAQQIAMIKLAKLTEEVLPDIARKFMYDNIKEAIKGLESRKPKEEQKDKEEKKEEPKLEDKKEKPKTEEAKEEKKPEGQESESKEEANVNLLTPYIL